MYDLAGYEDQRYCNPDPVYDQRYCGYSDHDGCLPLDGCGSSWAYPVILSFTVFTSLIYVNLFVGVVLDCYQVLSECVFG